MADDTHNPTDITTIPVLGKNSIHCGFHLVPYIIRTVVETIPASTYVLITDTTVANYHLDKFQDEFDSLLHSKASPSRFFAHVIPPGETSKSREGKASIEDYLLSQSCTRDTVILALGGGVIGDLVGFVAATLYVPLSRVSAATLTRNAFSACGECVSCRFPPLSSPWSIQASEGRRQSIPRTAKTSSARSGSPSTSSSTLPFLKLCRSGNSPMEWPRWSKYGYSTLTNSPLSDSLTCSDSRHLE
jgi:hypothetical protein